jgi:hypothetical protein
METCRHAFDKLCYIVLKSCMPVVESWISDLMNLGDPDQRELVANRSSRTQRQFELSSATTAFAAANPHNII